MKESRRILFTELSFAPYQEHNLLRDEDALTLKTRYFKLGTGQK